jgi:hypothetical protein
MMGDTGRCCLPDVVITECCVTWYHDVIYWSRTSRPLDAVEIRVVSILPRHLYFEVLQHVTYYSFDYAELDSLDVPKP